MSENVSTLVYDAIDEKLIAELREKHRWIVEPIYRASDAVTQMPIFGWIKSRTQVKEFAPLVTQLYYHSATFPKVMGLMLGMTPMSENHMMPFYAKHAFGEADHHQMLLGWMIRVGILKNASEIDHYIPTLETNACVNLAYQLAVEQDRSKWLVTINSGIERCSNDLFKVLAPKMRELGVGDEYFDIHVGADEHHSIMGLEHIQVQDATSVRGRVLVSKALEGIALWASMLHSWAKMSVHPRFNLDGSLVGAQSAQAA